MPLNAAPRFTGIHKPLHHDEVVILGGAFPLIRAFSDRSGGREGAAVSPYEGEIKVTRCAKNRKTVLYM